MGKTLITIFTAAVLLIAPNISHAQFFGIAPNLCPPGFTLVPPSSCIPNPTPPPEPERNPIVLIPGITVSQNKKLLYKDEEGGKWKFAFGFNVYKGLIKKLESAGYEEGDDLLIAHYDWRNPATHNATTYLKPIIDQAKQNTGASQVDVVAHSFGGIVTRAYIQSDDYDNDIDQLVTLGSPHQGSADAYVAWEGGIYPEGWKFWIKDKINRTEKALKKSRDQKDTVRPDSFRSFFPSLHDMLPLQDYVKQNDTLLATADLTEQNDFLTGLNNAFASIAARGVDLATIAGNSVATLNQVNISSDRTPEDEALNRWRDGHASPESPPLDSTDGDARVLLSSAHVGESNTTIVDAVHHKLPDEAQNQVFEILGLEEQPSFFFDFPNMTFGVTILSPISAVVTGPNGEILSIDQNTFGEDVAEYDDDPDDPDDPIDINFADPPPGNYTITYTGTGDGEYTIIFTYADDDEVISTTQDGITSLGEVFTSSFLVTDDSILVPPANILDLLRQLRDLDKKTIGKLHSKAKHLYKRGEKYQKEVDKHGFEHKHSTKGFSKLQKEFAKFNKEFDKQLDKGRLDDTAILELTGILNDLTATGL